MSRKEFDDSYWKLLSVIAPGLKYSQSIYEEVLRQHSALAAKWLDLGCGHKLLPVWRAKEEKNLIGNSEFIVGIDYDYLSLASYTNMKNKCRGDIAELPFYDNTFDLVTSNMVFEHLDKPEKQLREISRVLIKGGKLIFHTPNILSYATLIATAVPKSLKTRLVRILQGRKEEDVFSTYYKVNSVSQIRKLAKLCNFRIIQTRLICSSPELAICLPLAFIEVIWIRFLMSKFGRPLRNNIIAILEKV